MVRVVSFVLACCYFLFPNVNQIEMSTKSSFLLIGWSSTQTFFNVHFRYQKVIWFQRENCTKTIRTTVNVTAKKPLKNTEIMMLNVIDITELRRKHLVPHCMRSLKERIENECSILCVKKSAKTCRTWKRSS